MVILVHLSSRIDVKIEDNLEPAAYFPNIYVDN